MNLNSTNLENDLVSLVPLSLKHVDELLHIASEKDLIKYSPSSIHSRELLTAYINTALSLKQKQLAIPFAIYHKKDDCYIGSTRFGHIDTPNKVLHIGWTWISKAYQGTGVNRQIKFLMLEQAFKTMAFEKVSFRIDERNIRSRKAVEKIGGQLEGILRSNVVLSDGFRRNTCCYGILKSEWPTIKENIFKSLI